ncbi:hypothetical protein BaRGS_00004297, partial [Batillaria attramentaria]
CCANRCCCKRLDLPQKSLCKSQRAPVGPAAQPGLVGQPKQGPTEALCGLHAGNATIVGRIDIFDDDVGGPFAQKTRPDACRFIVTSITPR